MHLVKFPVLQSILGKYLHKKRDNNEKVNNVWSSLQSVFVLVLLDRQGIILGVGKFG